MSRREAVVARAVVLVLLAVIVAGAAYEAAVALEVFRVGPVPGRAPAGEGLFVGAAVMALLVGSLFAALFVVRPDRAPRIVPVLPLAGAAFALARWYAFDPYYAPTLRRASEGGIVAGSWMVGLVLLAAAAAVLTVVRPRAGYAATAVALIGAAFTAWIVRLGH